LAISVLLAKGNSYENISNILRVTPNTITKMSLKMKYGNGSVKKVSESITNSDSGKAIIEEILGVIQRKHINLGGDEFKTPSWERERKIRRLKKGI
jgi:hypothetical protein